jgi:hypothetical protein
MQREIAAHFKMKLRLLFASHVPVHLFDLCLEPLGVDERTGVSLRQCLRPCHLILQWRGWIHLNLP